MNVTTSSPSFLSKYSGEKVFKGTENRIQRLDSNCTDYSTTFSSNSSFYPQFINPLISANSSNCQLLNSNSLSSSSSNSCWNQEFSTACPQESPISITSNGDFSKKIGFPQSFNQSEPFDPNINPHSHFDFHSHSISKRNTRHIRHGFGLPHRQPRHNKREVKEKKLAAKLRCSVFPVVDLSVYEVSEETSTSAPIVTANKNAESGSVNNSIPPSTNSNFTLNPNSAPFVPTFSRVPLTTTTNLPSPFISTQPPSLFTCMQPASSFSCTQSPSSFACIQSPSSFASTQSLSSCPVISTQPSVFSSPPNHFQSSRNTQPKSTSPSLSSPSLLLTPPPMRLCDDEIQGKALLFSPPQHQPRLQHQSLRTEPKAQEPLVPPRASSPATLRLCALLSRRAESSISGSVLHKVRQRVRQIFFVKDTDVYRNYVVCIPKDRSGRAMTPNPMWDCSKKMFDYSLKVWREKLRKWNQHNVAKLEAQAKAEAEEAHGLLVNLQVKKESSSLSLSSSASFSSPPAGASSSPSSSSPIISSSFSSSSSPSSSSSFSSVPSSSSSTRSVSCRSVGTTRSSSCSFCSECSNPSTSSSDPALASPSASGSESISFTTFTTASVSASCSLSASSSRSFACRSGVGKTIRKISVEGNGNGSGSGGGRGSSSGGCSGCGSCSGGHRRSESVVGVRKENGSESNETSCCDDSDSNGGESQGQSQGQGQGCKEKGSEGGRLREKRRRRAKAEAAAENRRRKILLRNSNAGDRDGMSRRVSGRNEDVVRMKAGTPPPESIVAADPLKIIDDGVSGKDLV